MCRNAGTAPDINTRDLRVDVDKVSLAGALNLTESAHLAYRLLVVWRLCPTVACPSRCGNENDENASLHSFLPQLLLRDEPILQS